MYVYTCILLQYYCLDAIKHKRDFRRCFGIFFFLYPPVSSILSFHCNLSDIATKKLDSFICKGAEKQRAREWVVNEIL